MINKDKIKKALENNPGNYMSTTGQIADVSFKEGVEFALEEVKSISIEFVDWISLNYFSTIDIKNNKIIQYTLKTTGIKNILPKEELFNIFLKEKGYENI